MTPFMASKPVFITKRDAANTTHKPRLITVVQHLKQKKYTNLKHVFQHLRRTEYTLALKTTKVGSSIVVVTGVMAPDERLRRGPLFCYRPQTKLREGNVLEASVSHSVHRGYQTTPRNQTLSSRKNTRPDRK